MNFQNRLVHIVLLCLFLYAAASLFSSRRELSQAQKLEAALERELELLQAENQRMQQKLESGFSDEEIQQLARQRLGLVLPGEKIFYFTTDREA